MAKYSIILESNDETYSFLVKAMHSKTCVFPGTFVVGLSRGDMMAINDELEESLSDIAENADVNGGCWAALKAEKAIECANSSVEK